MNPITWTSDTEFTVNDLCFLCVLADYYSFSTTRDRIVLLKDRYLIERYIEKFADREIRNVLEFGIFQGGSPLLFTSLFGVGKFVGIDLQAPLENLDDIIRHYSLDGRISIHYGTSQGDATEVRRIIESEFLNQPIHLIIDDASHHYGPTKAAFETAFPYLRPAGTYIIEDWGWAHWPGVWQDPDHDWSGLPAMSNVIFELTMLCASCPALVESVEIYSNAVFVKKGAHGPADGQPIAIDELIKLRSRKFNLV